MATYTGHLVHPRWFLLEMDVDEIKENMHRWNTLTKEQQSTIDHVMAGGKDVPREAYEP